jgi:hypothetical protein
MRRLLIENFRYEPSIVSFYAVCKWFGHAANPFEPVETAAITFPWMFSGGKTKYTIPNARHSFPNLLIADGGNHDAEDFPARDL